ncbi:MULTISPECIES: ABC transporter ATP-binding protein [Microbacterium]|uniref:ABC transporter ATP-binding protein n=1 Tax=Microbacterium TaxID=33882 RepID=UPI00217F1B8B|nr:MULTISPECIES: ABC transporter ATP-binding protein [Microbacterium]UWF78326.1 ABC transporter ATP-binding protein [Microbacterium neungamense]WCM56503.1 ABC transporter ATP-binding protein [Microbacterium sp. EF45047]
MTTAAPAAQPAKDAESVQGSVSLQKLTKSFGDFTAVRDLDLDVAPGEFLSMLGPSGSGKTTVLRVIAGFESATSGTVRLSGVDVTRVPPHQRHVNTVFQDYALFPHMTIAENVGYGMRVRGTAKAERVTQVQEALRRVRLDHLADRLPHQLSGGQRQRIALARALILRPQVLLLDEPLGALDKQLREHMQIELKQIQREVGITFIFVTHDQEEALTLSDRVAVFNNGRIEQVGSAREVYENPQTEFVARFLGLSNLVEAGLAEELTGDRRTMSIRPERVRLLPTDAPLPDGDVGLAGTIREIVYTGPATRYLVAADAGMEIISEQPNAHDPAAGASLRRGDRVRAAWTPAHAARLP